ncbi:MAG: hypothetical protein DMG69_11590 [Acidobacteria bacterium]|nr:MAG: hypothetical protein DMG69_11590 [Acidobacteriota bacterium]
MRNLKMLLLSTAVIALIASGALTIQAQTAPDQTAPPGAGAEAQQANGSRNSMEVPSGAEIVVRTNEAINSKTASERKTYPAQVQQDVMGNNGQVLIPKGSTAELAVKKASSGGTTGSSDLALGLQSINIGGHPYQVSTANVNQSNQQGIGKNKRTGEMVGGGAALGTLLGAVAGGGKGALIGAIAGATGGGTAQVLTKGKEVKVPAETTLRFRLDQPMVLESGGQ